MQWPRERSNLFRWPQRGTRSHKNSLCLFVHLKTLYFDLLQRKVALNSTRAVRMNIQRTTLIFAVLIPRTVAHAQTSNTVAGPDPREIPVPPIKTAMKPMPRVKDLPVRNEMPDVLTMNDGAKVTTQKQWKKRRDEMKRILEYYAVGQMPPPPGNVKGEEIQSQLVLDGTVKYRLVRLTFGPKRKLELNIGIFTPTNGGPFPAIISQSGTPPGAPSLPRLPQGPNQGRGQDVLLLVGPAPETNATPGASPVVPGQESATGARGRGGF